MARFTVTGLVDGVAATVTWEDGAIDGSPDTAAHRVHEEIAVGSTVWATPTGPHFRAGLDPAAAVATIAAVFDGDGPLEIEGEIPTASLEPLGRGAIP